MHNKKIHIKFGSKIHKVLFDNAMGAGVGTSAVAQNDYGISVRILCPQMLIHTLSILSQTNLEVS